MKIQAINNNFSQKLSFGRIQAMRDNMSYENKLDKIYDMLKEQKKDLITLSYNQEKIQKHNNSNSRVIMDNLPGYISSNDRHALDDNLHVWQVTIIR